MLENIEERVGFLTTSFLNSILFQVVFEVHM